MTLIKSLSGIRGTIGGTPGDALTPVDIVKFTYAYCATLPHRNPAPKGERYKIVVGKDARISGDMVEQLVVGTLVSCGVDVVKCGFASTPTTEMAVLFADADGGIILTASHNPRQWNALKLLNSRGEFLTAAEGQEILTLAESDEFDFADVDHLGTIEEEDFTDRHLDAVLALEAVDADAVRKAGFTVALDAINSVGGIIMPRLLERLGVRCICLNCNPTGDFAHNPEPLPANLKDLSETVVREKADLGISVDPDVDRLAFICENGEPFVEEYTLVSVADYLCELAEKEGKPIATVSNLAHKKMKVSELKKTYPQYRIAKNRIELSDKSLIDKILLKLQEIYAAEDVNTVDGVKISFEAERKWVHLRKSNTEPIIRIYAEAPTLKAAETLAGEVIAVAEGIIRG